MNNYKIYGNPTVDIVIEMGFGADKLYISGHSSKESQAAYYALGCKHAKEINEILAKKEPFDVQLEYIL